MSEADHRKAHESLKILNEMGRELGEIGAKLQEGLITQDEAHRLTGEICQKFMERINEVAENG